MAIIVTKAFGGKESQKPKAVQNYEQAAQAMASIFGAGAVG